MSTTTPTVLGRAREQSVKVMKDPVPNLRAAGHEIVGVRDRENADYNVRADVHMKVPDTPNNLHKFRKTHVMQPGLI